MAVLVMALFPALAFADLQAVPLGEAEFGESDVSLNVQGSDFASATSIPLNQAQTGKLSSSSNTNDWHKVTLPSAGKLRIVFGGDYATSGRWEVSLYDSDKNRLSYEDHDADSTKDGDVCAIGLSAGTYYIEVDGWSQVRGLNYHFTPEFTASSAWEAELNDTIVTATPAQLGAKAYGNLQGRYYGSDTDWYKIDLPHAGTIGLLFAGDYRASGSWDIALYSAENKQIDYEYYNTSNTKASLVCVKGISAGTCYVKVTGAEDLPYSFTPYYIASKPTANAGLVYNGKTQTGVNKQEGSTLSGTVSAVNAGSYSATAMLDSSYVWPDGTRDAIAVPWTIAGGDTPSGGSGNSDSGKSDLSSYAGAARAAGFTDLSSGAWYMSTATGAFASSKTLYLDYTIKRGLMSGYAGSTLFGPNDTLSRGMAATIIYRMATGKTAANTDNNVATKFSDVPKGAWYAAAVKWCAENGVVTGYTDANGKPTGKFGPNDKVTREQLTAMISRYCVGKAGMKSAGSDVSRFKDAGKIAAWAREGVAFCAANGIVSGVGSTGNFEPQGLATRCQMSKIIAVTARALE